MFDGMFDGVFDAMFDGMCDVHETFRIASHLYDERNERPLLSSVEPSASTASSCCSALSRASKASTRSARPAVLDGMFDRAFHVTLHGMLAKASMDSTRRQV